MSTNTETQSFLVLGEAPTRLATVAAPFVAAGMGSEDALKRAYDLIHGAYLYINKRDGEDPIKRPIINMERMLGLLGVKKQQTFRDYMFSVFPENEAHSLWNLALNGEPAFTIRHLDLLKAHRKGRLAARGKAGAAARQNLGQRKLK